MRNKEKKEKDHPALLKANRPHTILNCDSIEIYLSVDVINQKSGENSEREKKLWERERERESLVGLSIGHGLS